MDIKWIDTGSFIFAGVMFVIALFILFTNSGELLSSIAAALLTAALSWVSYVLVRWIYLALRS